MRNRPNWFADYGLTYDILGDFISFRSVVIPHDEDITYIHTSLSEDEFYSMSLDSQKDIVSFNLELLQDALTNPQKEQR